MRKKPKAIFTEDLNLVREREKEYIEKRREQNSLKSLKEAPGLYGICFSGGGIRSATFNLGIIQGLIKTGILKKFDYLSTVSGGGYIGSCLTSLLSGDKSKISGKELGVDPDNSPFAGLNQFDNYSDGEHTKLSVRHQMHHLRTHGDFLIHEKGLFKRATARAVGNVLSGLSHNLILFLMFLFIIVSFSHMSISLMTGNRFFSENRHEYIVDENLTDIENVTTFFPEWIYNEILMPAVKMFQGISEHPLGYIIFFVLGIIWSLAFTYLSIKKSNDIALKNYYCPPAATKSGFNAEDYYESKFISGFNTPLIILPVLALLLSHLHFSTGIDLGIFNSSSTDNHFSFFFLPFAFSIGTLISSFSFNNLALSFLPDQNRIHRSLLDSLKGASFLQSMVMLTAPLIILALFSLNYLSVIFPSLTSIVLSYLLFDKGKGSDGIMSKFKIPQMKKYLLNLFLILFTGLTFSFVSGLILKNIYSDNLTIIINSLIVLAASSILFFIWGILINSNKISPHYFYRDRLTENYLKTDARIKRDKKDRQGMPLKVLRNDESLKLSEIGDDNFRGPYHLIVTALNLQGSDELNRKTMLSEHFIFSKYFTGSKITGYVDTSVYRGGNTKLARAVAISGAAVASAMGYLSFWGQNFASTLFNARLGYWMTNPWYYKNYVDNITNKIRVNDKYVFWPKYLAMEMTGKVDARSSLVNLSDGGHTGDNLGLLPLLQRRCKLILICDAEADKDYNFGSFNNAVRMAFIEENIKIDIDLSKIEPSEDEAGELISEESIAVGKICYPAENEKEKPQEGILVYIKSSLCNPEGRGSIMPVHIINYKKKYSDYPHQSTMDQFFDDAQFEAYRALGEYISSFIGERTALKNLFA